MSSPSGKEGLNMISESYDFLDWFWDYSSFQPPMLSCGELMSMNIEGGRGPGFVGIMFSSTSLFIMHISEFVDVDMWVHEFVEISLSGIITEILELRPLISIPVCLFDTRLGWCSAGFCHYLAALTTGQGWSDEKYDHCTMEADEVWPWMESAIKNNLKEDIKIERCKE